MGVQCPVFNALYPGPASSAYLHVPDHPAPEVTAQGALRPLEVVVDRVKVHPGESMQGGIMKVELYDGSPEVSAFQTYRRRILLGEEGEENEKGKDDSDT